MADSPIATVKSAFNWRTVLKFIVVMFLVNLVLDLITNFGGNFGGNFAAIWRSPLNGLRALKQSFE